MIFLAIFLVLLSGCLTTQKESQILSSYQKEYYNVNDKELEILTPILTNGDVEECQNVVDRDISRESVLLTVKCRELLIKINAFNKKDYALCQDLNMAGDSSKYEECISPIVAYSAISLKDPTYCKKYLTTERLSNLCEKEYGSQK